MRLPAARGELRTQLPVGYVHDEAGAVVVDSDAEVQAAIRDLFAACKFQQCGPFYLRAIPALSGPMSGQRSPHRKCQTLPRRYPTAPGRSRQATRVHRV
jgi:hypothetical protein